MGERIDLMRKAILLILLLGGCSWFQAKPTYDFRSLIAVGHAEAILMRAKGQDTNITTTVTTTVTTTGIQQKDCPVCHGRGWIPTGDHNAWTPCDSCTAPAEGRGPQPNYSPKLVSEPAPTQSAPPPANLPEILKKPDPPELKHVDPPLAKESGSVGSKEPAEYHDSQDLPELLPTVTPAETPPEAPTEQPQSKPPDIFAPVPRPVEDEPIEPVIADEPNTVKPLEKIADPPMAQPELPPVPYVPQAPEAVSPDPLVPADVPAPSAPVVEPDIEQPKSLPPELPPAVLPVPKPPPERATPQPVVLPPKVQPQPAVTRPIPSRQVKFLTQKTCRWCQAWKANVLPDLKKKGITYGYQEYNQIQALDIDTNPYYANKYLGPDRNQWGLPTYILFENGHEIHRASGYLPLADFIKFSNAPRW